MLSYKARWYGRSVVAINRWYPSSKRCSACGHELESLSLAVREWTCPICGAVHDRDINAALNIKAEGLSVFACGEQVETKPAWNQGRHASRKQETHLARGGIPSPLGDREEVNARPGRSSRARIRCAPLFRRREGCRQAFASIVPSPLSRWIFLDPVSLDDDLTRRVSAWERSALRRPVLQPCPLLPGRRKMPDRSESTFRVYACARAGRRTPKVRLGGRSPHEASVNTAKARGGRRSPRPRPCTAHDAAAPT